MIKLYDGQIIDILPAGLARDEEVKALSYSINKAMKRVFDRLNSALIMLNVSGLHEDILDARAAELNTPYYDENLPFDTKVVLVKKTIQLYRKAGTPTAVKEMIDYVFGSGMLIEWFENNGTPGTFQIVTTEPLSADTFNLLNKIVSKIKNVSSSLDKVIAGQKLETETHIAAFGTYAIRMMIK